MNQFNTAGIHFNLTLACTFFNLFSRIFLTFMSQAPSRWKCWLSFFADSSVFPADEKVIRHSTAQHSTAQHNTGLRLLPSAHLAAQITPEEAAAILADLSLRSGTSNEKRIQAARPLAMGPARASHRR